MPTPLQLFQIARFGGLNRRISKFLIRDDQCQDILNLWFYDQGALTKMPGFVKWNATSLGAFKMLGGERFYKTGATPQFIEVNNGTIYAGTDGPQTFASVGTGFSTTATWRMKVMRDLLFMINGTDVARKWDGTAISQMGVPGPTTAPTVALGAAGILNATYSYKITFVTLYAESVGSPVSANITPVNQQVNLTAIPIGPTTNNLLVTKRRIYRTLANGGAAWKFLAEIPDNTTTLFTDNAADSTLGADIPATSFPPTLTGARYIEMWKNRLWMAGDATNPRRLAFSEYFLPETWPTTYYIDIPMTPGDEITGLKILGDILVVYGHNTPFLVIGETPFDFVVKRSFAQTGTESDRSVVLVENAHIYLSRFGVYAFDGAIARLLSDEIEPSIRELIPATGTIYIGQAAAAYHQRRKIYRLAVTNTTVDPAATTNNREYIYDLRVQAWTQTDRTVAYYHHLDGPGDAGQIFTAHPTAGFLYQEDVGESADGGTMFVTWTSKAYPLGQLDFWKILRHTMVWLVPSLDTITYSVTLNDVTQQTFTIPAAGVFPLYGTALYGTGVYGGPAITRFNSTFAQTMQGRYVVFNLQANTSNKMKFYSVEASYKSNPNIRVR
jgi:hypothetical protein